jgi:hypothetical protein
MFNNQRVRLVSLAVDVARLNLNWLRNVLVIPRGRDLSVLFLGGVLETKGKGDVGEAHVVVRLVDGANLHGPDWVARE